jgi:ubiquitin carboxyl-terminal hydrolase 7
MLVYIRKAELPQVISESDLSDIPDALAQRFIDEREIENIKRKEKQDTHLFMAVTIITDEQFDGHQGKSI